MKGSLIVSVPSPDKQARLMDVRFTVSGEPKIRIIVITQTGGHYTYSVSSFVNKVNGVPGFVSHCCLASSTCMRDVRKAGLLYTVYS